MSKLVIRKRVTLEFLGDEYKDAYIDFKSIPIGDYDKLIEDINSAGKDDSNKANKVILQILKQYYLGAEFPNDKGVVEPLDSKEELDNLDKDALLECFGKITGQDLRGAIDNQVQGTEVDVDPKSESQSKAGSTQDIPPR